MASFNDSTEVYSLSDNSTAENDTTHDLSEFEIKLPGKKIKPKILSDSEDSEDQNINDSKDNLTESQFSTNTRQIHSSEVETKLNISEVAEDDLHSPISDYIGDIDNFADDAKFNSTSVQEYGTQEAFEMENESKLKNIPKRSLSSAQSTDIFESTTLSQTDSVKIIADSAEEIIISDSDEDVKPDKPSIKKEVKQEGFVKPLITSTSPQKNSVSRLEYIKMKQDLENLNYEKRKLQTALGTIKLNTLPDNGQALLRKQKELDSAIQKQQEMFANVQVIDEVASPITWRGIEQGATNVQPRTFGKQALQTYNNEKALTLDRLHNLHASLKSCPTTETIADDPQGIKVDLMLHQKQALAWLLWREQQKPAGGILADDMGLGKTLTMISVILASKQLNENNDSETDSDDENESEEEQRQYKYNGGTLVVCPASLIGQWANEVSDKVKSNLLKVETYHGPKRETKAKRLSRYDMVITTYAICQSEGESDTPLYRIKWNRIILDEAHQIRNHKSKTSVAVFRLGGKRRWALTGTPVHNKELDLFALLKFLRCSPFDDIAVFKRWISSKNGGGNQRLHTVLQSLLIRRTKEQLKELEQMTCLPEREWELVEIEMDKDEMGVYKKVLLFSKTLFAQFLHQRAEKNADAIDNMEIKLNDPSNEYYKMHKRLVQMNKLPEVKQSDILVLLLRLRQICCHPSLITAMLDNVADFGEDVEDADVSVDNLLDQLNKLNIDEHEPEQEDVAIGAVGIGLAEASRNLLNPSNPIFERERQSAKMREVIKLLKEKIMPLDDKVIIVSQWTSLLQLIVPHIEALDLKYCNLNGSVPVKDRGQIVCNFNNPKSDIKIMLLSLTAGGVGLNLVGANHLIFLDLHWNPQLEMQAQDRIYRFGQRKKVHIYKFMTMDTIEQRIKLLQDKKKELADDMLKGSKTNQSKLSMDDLKMLFNM